MSDVAFDDSGELSERGVQLAAARSTTDVRPVPRISIQAFCDSPEIGAVIEAAARDRRMARAHVKVHSGGIAAGG
ncbi:MAG: CtpF protein, partial [Bauldia sp.]